MDDDTIISRIRALVEEEDGLSGPDNPLTRDDARRRDAVEAELDQCYDLLRQRRAKRRQRQDPDDAEVRSREQVESYVGEEGGPAR